MSCINERICLGAGNESTFVLHFQHCIEDQLGDGLIGVLSCLIQHMARQRAGLNHGANQLGRFATHGFDAMSARDPWQKQPIEVRIAGELREELLSIQGQAVESDKLVGRVGAKNPLQNGIQRYIIHRQFDRGPPIYLSSAGLALLDNSCLSSFNSLSASVSFAERSSTCSMVCGSMLFSIAACSFSTSAS